ncbi:MAG: chloride channel protein [Clostridia bacterium]|nr:chloride channel protein [Clostridia bacterium]
MSKNTGKNFGEETLLERFSLIFGIKIRHEASHLSFFMKWLLISIILGTISGLAGAAFHVSAGWSEEFFQSHQWMIAFLPFSGLLTVAIYRGLKVYHDEGTNSILRSARGEDESAIKVAPLIFTATCLTQITGGSAGREGAALQIGGSIASFLGRKAGMSKYEKQMMIMCGMSATFCALFGTPVASAIFSMEVAGVGTVYYAGLVPSMIASVIATLISNSLGARGMEFSVAGKVAHSPDMFIKVLILAAFLAFLSILYCSLIHTSMRFFQKEFENPYMRILFGAFLLILITLLIGSFDYNCAGTSMIEQALSGNAAWNAFLIKLLLTMVTIGAGFKGGEIIPTMFIGATFGCVIGPILGIDPVFAAEVGLIGLFCGAVNCPLTSILLSVELFGSNNFIFFGLTAAVSYMLSGYYSLYSGQKFMNSKLIPVPFERHAH